MSNKFMFIFIRKLIKEENIETECIFNDLRQERYKIYHQDLM